MTAWVFGLCKETEIRLSQLQWWYIVVKHSWAEVKIARAVTSRYASPEQIGLDNPQSNNNFELDISTILILILTRIILNHKVIWHRNNGNSY